MITAVVGGCFIHEQLRLMRESNEITRQSLDFAKMSAADGDAATKRALEIADRSAQAAERATELTSRQLAQSARLERANIVVEDISRLSLSSTKRLDGVNVRVRNVGRAPAESVQILTRPSRPVELTGLPLFLRTQLPCDRWVDGGMIASALAPGQDTTYATAPIKLTAQTANNIYQGKANMFLWFKIRYTDALGPSELTSCFVITGTGHAPRLPPTNPWRRCGAADFQLGARMRCEEQRRAK